MERPAFFAGQWYPADEGQCRAAIESHAADTTPEQGRWRGLIGPHAGWTYSGNVCSRAYRWLAFNNPHADLVIIFGSHRGPRGPNTAFMGDTWWTPLGPLENARRVARELKLEALLLEEPVHPRHPDNAIELHLPFLKYFFPRAKFVMVGVESSLRGVEIGEKAARQAKDHDYNPVFVASTDLTHYGPAYRFEPRGPGHHAVSWVREDNDRAFIEHVLGRNAEGAVAHANKHASACCPGAVAACLGAVSTLSDLSAPRLLDHYLSYDVRPSTSFVGYAGILL